MKRRGFLGRLVALAAVPKLAEKLQYEGLTTELVHPYPTPEQEAIAQAMSEKTVLTGYSDIAQALKEAYPPGWFEAEVQKRSSFHEHFKGQT